MIDTCIANVGTFFHSSGLGYDYIDTTTAFVTPHALHDILGLPQISIRGLLQRVMSTLVPKPIHSFPLNIPTLSPFRA